METFEDGEGAEDMEESSALGVIYFLLPLSRSPSFLFSPLFLSHPLALLSLILPLEQPA